MTQRRRIAFVGDLTVFGPAMLRDATPALLPTIVDLPPGAPSARIRAELDRCSPHVVVALGPPFPDPDVLAALDAVVLAHAAEPADAPWADRLLVAHDAPAAAWRQAPLPVDDRLFAAVRPSAAPPRVIFLGRSTEHRERVLSRVKHDFDVLHVADGIHGPDLEQLLERTDVGLNTHRTATGGFEHRVAVHLAAGHLLVSEPLTPSHGLEPGIDFLEAADGDAMHRVVSALRRHPDLERRVRVRGRRKAEQFRASRLWPRLVGDALRDIATFGTARQHPS